MGEQNFHSAVEQVAGRDIVNNHFGQTGTHEHLGDRTSPELRQISSRAKWRRNASWAMQHVLWPLPMLALTVLAAAALNWWLHYAVAQGDVQPLLEWLAGLQLIQWIWAAWAKTPPLLAVTVSLVALFAAVWVDRRWVQRCRKRMAYCTALIEEIDVVLFRREA